MILYHKTKRGSAAKQSGRLPISARTVSILVGCLLLLSASSLSALAQSGAADRTPAYRIGAEDVLEISVWREPELQREVLVRPDGGISFPLAGDIDVAGRTPREVEVDIAKRIRKYIPEAVVSVSVKKVSGYTIFVIGKVNNPGQFVLGRYVDVMQALTLAGGLTPYASEGNIKVLRRSKDDERTFDFEYNDVKKGRNLDQNIVLQSGDVVVVP